MIMCLATVLTTHDHMRYIEFKEAGYLRYMIRESFTAVRGQVPAVFEDIKILISVMKSQGITDHKLYADISGNMDTMIHK